MHKPGYFILLCCLFIPLQITLSQKEIDHWETVIFAEDSWKYFVGVSNPPADWREVSFDDNLWETGKGGIGYGDNDDSTIVSSTLSLYLRKSFTIYDTGKISQAVLHVDYDDAFVAYINGTEVARSNIGVRGDSPPFNQPASANHEAVMYRGGLPEEFSVFYQVLKNCLQEGGNVLAVQVHNVALSSTDLSSIIYFSAGINDTLTYFHPVPGWFVEPPPPPEPFISSNLPVIVINTNNIPIPDEPKITADIGIICHGYGNRNFITDEFNEYSGKIGIETRGNVTQSFPKKAYLFETRDSAGENLNVPLVGLPEENDWILQTCYIDKTLMRNSIACMMSRKTGQYASGTVFCELILNGSYEGVYVLMEKIKRDNNRVSVDELNPGITSGDSLTGGYIYQVSQSGDDFGERRRYVYPAADEINSAQSDYIRKYDDHFRATMNQANYNDPLAGYPLLIDVNTFIDEIIVQEACKNSDAYGWSSFFYKDRLRKLSAGPIWDFDQALSNSTFNEGSRINEWLINKGLDDVPSFWSKLFLEPNFRYLLKKRWFELRNDVLHTDSIMSFIDSTASYLDEAQQRNFRRWPILGVELWRSLPGWDTRDTYQKEVDYMKTWLSAHLVWIDQQLTSVPDRVIDVPKLIITEIMYDPVEGRDLEFIEIVNNDDKDINLTGIFFAKGITYTFPNGITMAPNESVILASNAVWFEWKYGFPPFGQYYGQLDNSGENIVLQTSLGCEIDAVRYHNEAPWPVPDGITTKSIELISLLSDNSLPENWALSPGTPKNDLLSALMPAIYPDARIFPNPASDYINIALSEFYGGQVDIEIYDLYGSLKIKVTTRNAAGENILLNINSLNNGTYIAQVTTENTVLKQPIVILH